MTDAPCRQWLDGSLLGRFDPGHGLGQLHHQLVGERRLLGGVLGDNGGVQRQVGQGFQDGVCGFGFVTFNISFALLLEESQT